MLEPRAVDVARQHFAVAVLALLHLVLVLLVVQAVAERVAKDACGALERVGRRRLERQLERFMVGRLIVCLSVANVLVKRAASRAPQRQMRIARAPATRTRPST